MTTANGRGTPQGAHHRLLKGVTAPFLDSARSGFARPAEVLPIPGPGQQRPNEKAAQTPLSAHRGQFEAFEARAQVAEQAAARVRSEIL